MNILAIILETMSFFLVTFDLYNQNKPNEIPNILIQLSRLVRLLLSPFILLAIFFVCAITINLVFTPDYHFFNFEKILPPIGWLLKCLFIIESPLFVTIVIIKLLASYYEEKRKPIFIIIGCVLFVISKSLSLFSELGFPHF